METTTADSLQHVQHALTSRWPSINDTVSWVTLIFGLLIYVIAYFAGGKQNQRKILFTMIFCIVAGALSMPIFQKLELFLSNLFSPFSLYKIWVIFLSFNKEINSSKSLLICSISINTLRSLNVLAINFF